MAYKGNSFFLLLFPSQCKDDWGERTGARFFLLIFVLAVSVAVGKTKKN